MARRSGRGPSHRDRRCRDHGAHFHRPASEAARPRYPHARGGRTGLPWTHHPARCPTSRRMGRTNRPAGRGADCIRPSPHRDLPVPASRPRCDDVTGSIHRCTRSAFRSPRPHGARADVIAVCALRRRTVRYARLNRHRNRARRHARVGGAGQRGACAAGRDVCQPSARNHAGRCVRVPRHRAYEPAPHPASRRRGWRRAHRRRAFGARPLACSRRCGSFARRRNRHSRRCRRASAAPGPSFRTSPQHCCSKGSRAREIAARDLG